MVLTRKHNGVPRRTVDMQALNKASVRTTYHTEPPFRQAMSVPQHMYKTTCDAWEGYHSVAIAESDSHLTTFITPWGRYMASGDAYTHRFNLITKGIDNVMRVTDDSLFYEKDIATAFSKTAEYLTLLGKIGIILSPTKFIFCKITVDWAGIRLGPDLVQPLPSHVNTIKTFPSPTNITDLRSFFALINQISPYYATQCEFLLFRDLLKKSSRWNWAVCLVGLPSRFEIYLSSRD